jgi:hypothetical protein
MSSAHAPQTAFIQTNKRELASNLKGYFSPGKYSPPLMKTRRRFGMLCQIKDYHKPLCNFISIPLDWHCPNLLLNLCKRGYIEVHFN